MENCPCEALRIFPSSLSESLANFSAAARAFFGSFFYHFGFHFIETGKFIRHVIFIIPSRDGNALLQEFCLPGHEFTYPIHILGSDSDDRRGIITISHVAVNITFRPACQSLRVVQYLFPPSQCRCFQGNPRCSVFFFLSILA